MSSSSSSISSPLIGTAHNETLYDSATTIGVMCIAISGLISLAAILCLLAFKKPQRRTFQNTNFFGYFMSLLLANAMQSIGTVMNFKWVDYGGVVSGSFCSAQGGIKQAGNIATALWSLMISVHVFNLLFLRSAATRYVFWGTIVIGWGLIITVILIGPTVSQRPEKGRYFDVSGLWCWITRQYPLEQIYLEYFLEFFSAVVGFLLYTIVILRVRGNLVSSDGKWRFQLVPRGQSWQLSLGRDLIDAAMVRVAQHMVWYPVVYAIILLPLTVTRLLEFSGNHVPLGATIFTDVIFNLTGFVNVLLLVITHRYFPEVHTLPKFSTPRNKHISVSLSKAGGVTPFTLSRSTTAEKYRRERAYYVPFPPRVHARTGSSSGSSSSSMSSDSVRYKNGEMSVSAESS